MEALGFVLWGFVGVVSVVVIAISVGVGVLGVYNFFSKKFKKEKKECEHPIYAYTEKDPEKVFTCYECFKNFK